MRMGDMASISPRRCTNGRSALWAGFAFLLAACAQQPDDPAGPLSASAEANGRADLPEATSALGSYLAGRHARLRHDTAAAHFYYGRALDEDATNSDLLRAALTSAVAARDLEAAAVIADGLRAAKPDSPAARLTLATVGMLQGDAAAAEAELDAASATGINVYLFPLLRAWSLAGQDDSDGALAALQPLVERSAFAGTHDYHAGLIADLFGRTTTADSAFAGALSAERGGAPRVVLAAGNFYRRHGRDDEARAVYDAFLDENPDSMFLDTVYRDLDSGAEAPPPLISSAAEGYAEALYGVAVSLFRETATEAALVHAQLCLAARADHDACGMLLGDIYAEVGRYHDAAEAYDGVGVGSPLKWALRLRAADVLREIDRIDEAAGLLRIMALEHPGRADPLIALADLMLREERYEEAVASYDRALALIPTLENRHWTLLYARGMSLERSKEWDRAERDFLRALELEPDQPLVLNYLGYSWVEMGRNFERARAMIEKAVAQRPNDGYIVDSLGWVMYSLGDYEAAAQHLERAVELRPADPVILDHFGDGLWRVGRRNEARFQWRRALVFEPEADLETSLRDKLENGLPVEREASSADAEDL